MGVGKGLEIGDDGRAVDQFGGDVRRPLAIKHH
jgi:hypothetical protein